MKIYSFINSVFSNLKDLQRDRSGGNLYAVAIPDFRDETESERR